MLYTQLKLKDIDINHFIFKIENKSVMKPLNHFIFHFE